jgi:hypothetical protein
MTEFFEANRTATAFDHDSTSVVAMELSGESGSGGGGSGVSRRPQARPEAWRHGRVAANYAIAVMLYSTPSIA